MRMERNHQSSTRGGYTADVRRACLSAEIHCDGVSATDHNTNVFVRARLVAAGQHRRERRHAARLPHNAKHPPQCLLCLTDRIICDQHNSIHVLLGDREDVLADTPRSERVRRDPARL